MATNLFRTLQNLKEDAKDAIWALSSCICQPSAKVKINGRTFKIIKVLGEGGFSFVYLAEDEQSGRQFALKKIRCPTGSEAVKEAMREVEAYRRFKHPNLIRLLDTSVEQDREGDGKIVYLFLPVYSRGNLQDRINANSLSGTIFPEREMVRLFKGACLAVRAMHDYHVSIPADGPHPAAGSLEDGRNMEHDDDHGLPQPEGDAEDGFSYENGPSVPMKKTRKNRPRLDAGFGGDDEELAHLNPDGSGERTADTELSTHPGTSRAMTKVLVPYAHRDIKPANIMISDEGNPILMDLGSAIMARIPIDNRQQALVQQDIAAEQSTMPYRAPELFDVKTGETLDEKVDIWSLGCTLFALAYNHSPFEPNQYEQGGSIAMAVQNAQYKHPSNSAYSQGLRDLIDSMIIVDPKKRPDIHQVIAMTDRVLQSLS